MAHEVQNGERLDSIDNSISDLKQTVERIRDNDLSVFTSLSVLAAKLDQYIEQNEKRIERLEGDVRDNNTRDTNVLSTLSKIEVQIDSIHTSVLGESTKGQPRTLIERVGELEVTIMEHERRLGTLNKGAVETYDRLNSLKDYEEYMGSVKQTARFLARWQTRLNDARKDFVEFLKTRKRKIVQAFAQNVILRIIVALVTLLASSPIWAQWAQDIGMWILENFLS